MNRAIKQNLLKMQGFYLFSFFAVGSLTPLLSVYLNEVENLDGFQIGMIMSVGPIVMIVFQPIWGMMCDWTSKPTKILANTTVTAGLIGLGYLWVHDYAWLVILAIALAIFQSAIIPVSDSITLQYTSKIGGNYGKIRMYGSLGFGVAVFVMGRLSETSFGLEVIFYAFFIGLVIASAIAIRFPVERRRNDKTKMKGSIRELAKMKHFVLFLLITFLVFGPNLANNAYYGLFIEASGGTYAGIGIAFLFAVFSEIPFMRFAGQWIYKIGILPVILIACTSSVFRFLFYFTAPDLNLIYITTIVQGFSLGLFIPAGFQYINQIVPSHMIVTAIALHSAISNGLGNWFSTFFAGILLDYYDIFTVYLFFGILSLLGLILTVFLYVDERKQSITS